MDRARKARENMTSWSANCAQSVITVFCEELGMDKDLAMRIAWGFGGGMGVSKGTCGAVTGAYMVLGLGGKRSGDFMKDRADIAAATDEFRKRFLARHASLNCTDLCGYDLSIPEKAEEALQKNALSAMCPPLVRDAAKILEDLLQLK